MAVDREVGGIRCCEVLERLSDYVDGEVGDELRARIEDHLRGCDWCDRFGSQFSQVVSAVRRELSAEPTASDGLAQRLLGPFQG